MLEYLNEGGLFMWVIFACSVIMLGVVLERWLALREAEVDSDDLLDRLGETIDSGDMDGALELCEGTPGPVAETLAVGLRKLRFLEGLGKSPEEIERGIEEAMEDHGGHVVSFLERFLPALATIAALAPILGMIGTVVGMIDAFDSIQAAGNVRPEAVAGGISTALLTTAGGLIVAAPATIAYNYFTNRVNRLVLQVQAAGSEFVERLLKIHAEGRAD